MEKHTQNGIGNGNYVGNKNLTKICKLLQKFNYSFKNRSQYKKKEGKTARFACEYIFNNFVFHPNFFLCMLQKNELHEMIEENCTCISTVCPIAAEIIQWKQRSKYGKEYESKKRKKNTFNSPWVKENQKQTFCGMILSQ